YERTGNLQDLETAIARSEAAVEGTPEDHPDRAKWLNNLGSYFNHRYQRTGNLQDLEVAIARADAAIEATPEDHPNQGTLLCNLGSHLSCRYQRTGNLQDLEAAIAQSEAAAKAIPEDHPSQAILLNNLGNLFNCRYQRTGNLQDLEAAIVRVEASIKATPEDHPNQAGILGNLGSSLYRRYERTRNLQDLEAAIARSEAALQATPEDHPNQARWLSNLGSHFSCRYELTGNLQDLETAIARSEAAIQATPEDHPNRAVRLINLGSDLRSRHKLTGNLEDLVLEATVDLLLTAWSVIAAPILIRLHIAYGAANILAKFPSVKDLPRAYSLLRNSIHLLPLLTSRSLQREDQQYMLGQLNGLVSLAVSISLEVGELPLEALRLQELGRSVTNGQLLDYRSDISDLRKHYPVLAAEFDSLRQELDSPLPVLDSLDMSINQLQFAQESTIRRRNRAVKDFENIILQIRQKPEFQNFLLAQSEVELLSAAQGGTIVLLNVSALRSDAILVTTTKVTSIPLPKLSHTLLHEYVDIKVYDNKLMRELLEWLWKGAVLPVLQELEFYPKIVDPLPRIWWIGVGLMAKVPIHAAAKFKKGKVHMTTLQYCLSSYTSTIRALRYSRARQCQHNDAMLIVAMPTTPGEQPLSEVTKEAKGIKYSTNFSKVEIMEWPSAERVLKVLPEYTIAHFACHGVSSINPADSHLLLRKELVAGVDEELAEVDKLRVKDITALKLPAARIAYLSACSTAQSASSELVDEVTHIVSAFHIAGFTHVIGTLWMSEDQACQKMALDFYGELKENDVAASYRTAIMKLMLQKPSQPVYWAPFIHFGA
ncbi:hypothetical protein L211DRAFT_748680, partial [Terfezia boudieri ATCC MYA-4762]